MLLLNLFCIVLVIILSILISSSLCVSIFDSEINVELKNWQADFKQNYENILISNYEKQITDLRKLCEKAEEFSENKDFRYLTKTVL